MKRRLPLLLVLLSAVLAAACRLAGPATPTPVPTANASERQLRVLDALWSAVNDKYIYEDFNGVDWQAAHDEAQAQIEAGLSEEEFVAAVRAMLDKLPEGTVSWQTREERLESQSEDTSTYEGIGAFVSVRAEPEPRVILLDVMPQSPAEQAGLAAHDAIYAIDGEPVLAEEGDSVIERVRGPADTNVTLTVQSPGAERRDVQVQRDQVTSSAQLRAGIANGTEIAYFLLPTQPIQEMANTMFGALQGLAQEHPLEGMILDLRIAHTGGQWPLGELLTLLGDGPMGESYTRGESQPLDITGQDFAGSQTLPLVILVGPDTEGAPEVLAGVLQATGRAKIAGLPTPGRIEGITETALPDGSRVFIASSSFVTSDGRDLGLEGVAPDETVEADWDAVSDLGDPVLDAATQLILAE